MTKLYWHLLGGAIATFGGIAIMLFTALRGTRVDVVSLIIFSGAVGGVVNNYYRLGKLAESKAPPPDATLLQLIAIQMYASIFIAAILGFVMYGLLLSGLVGGAAFPKFTHLADSYLGMQDLLTNLAPETNIDAAKSILWGFMAGFSERLVPNLIDKAVAKADKG